MTLINSMNIMVLRWIPVCTGMTTGWEAHRPKGSPLGIYRAHRGLSLQIYIVNPRMIFGCHRNETAPGKNFTGILPKSRFFGQKWLNNMLGEAKVKEFATVKTEQSKMYCRFYGKGRQLEIRADHPKSGNHPGKNFTGILPKSRFFGQKWLNNMLGEAKVKEFATVKTEQSKMDCRFYGKGRQLEIRADHPKSGNHPGKKLYRNFTEIAFFRAKMAK